MNMKAPELLCCMFLADTLMQWFPFHESTDRLVYVVSKEKCEKCSSQNLKTLYLLS